MVSAFLPSLIQTLLLLMQSSHLQTKVVRRGRLPKNSRKNKRKAPRRGNIFWRRGLNKITKPFSNTEIKYVDQTGTITPNTSQTTVQLNVLSQGTTVSTRLGNSIRMLGVEVNLKYSINSSATHTTGRIALYIDHQPNGATVAAGVVFTAPTNVVSLLNPDSQFRVQMLTLETVSVSISGRQEVVCSFSQPLYTVVRYQSNNGDITDIITNALHLGLTSDESTNTPTFAYYARVSFVDD